MIDFVVTNRTIHNNQIMHVKTQTSPSMENDYFWYFVKSYSVQDGRIGMNIQLITEERIKIEHLRENSMKTFQNSLKICVHFH